MKKLFFMITALVFLIILSFALNCQTRISYAIPDVGTLGMGVYVEVIAPTNSFGNFGEDTLYPDNNGKVKIIFDKPEDSSKIIIGPIVVSWQGRLLSTYFFISPDLEEPNSSDWSLLDSKFRIPFRVQVDGNLSNPDTFYIVKPYDFGTVLQNNQIFGTGQLGRRSPSGAIVVDSLNLSSLEYKAFLDNSTVFPFQNRSYLPFIILCTNHIKGLGSNTKISVNAGDLRLQNGGPGGGGGGGRFCDFISGNPGEDGGNGFTAGGRGGVNYFLSGNGAYKNLGCGTGDSGKSLNGVFPASNPGGWEASGGGTGHPFGKSGIGSGDQSNWNVPGGYGGGTGSINNRMGGSGGFATNGQNEPSNYVNGGKIHGNPMIVPIAGGSGGASGNPSGLNVCSGSGGGGGGAIRIFAKRIENISLLANGANGGQSSNGAGGGGSGGSISVCAKEFVQNLSLSAQGGNGGGRGYFRVDAPTIFNVTFSHNDPPAYIGLSTDTNTFVKRKFILTGSKNPSSDVVQIYLRSKNSSWVLYKTVSGFSNQNKWTTEIILPDTSKVFYIAAIQDLNNAVIDTFKYQPRYLLSQAAMNILKRIPQGICSGTPRISFSVYDCPGRIYLDSGVIKNIGDGDLTVYFSRARFIDNQSFELISPKSDVILPPNDSVKFYFRFVATGNNPSSVIFDSLFVEHSDDEWSFNPWKVQIRAELFPYNFDLYSLTNLQIVDTLKLGSICKLFMFDTTILLVNKSVFPINYRYKFNPINITLNNSNSYLGYNFADTLLIFVKPSKIGDGLDSIIVYPEDCPELEKKVYFKYFLLDINTEFFYQNKRIDTLFLGEVCIGDTISLSYFLFNRSNYPLNILSVDRNISPELQAFIPNLVDIDINQSIENKLLCIPRTEGTFTNVFIYNFDQCDHKDTLIVIYKVVKSNAVAILGTYFGYVQVGQSDTSIVVIVNKGTGIAYFDKEPPSSSYFEFLGSIPEIPTYLRPNDTLKLVYRFTPDKEGEYKSFVEYISNSENDCPDTINFELKGYGTNANIFANVDSVYLGLFPYCKSKDTVIYITNTGTTNLIIRKVEIQQSYKPEHFILSNSLSQNVIPPKTVDSCVVKFVGIRGAPSGLKTGELVIESNDVNNPQIRIKLSAFQENLNVDLKPDTIDFGICQIGDFNTRRLKLINNGKYHEPQRVRDFEGNKNIFDPSPSVAIIYPSDSVEILFTFQPDREGEIFDSIRIIYFQPCPDTQWVYLRGWGTSGNFFVKDTLDFGDLVLCSLDTLIFNVTNLGTIPFRVDSAIIFGFDAANFSILDKFPKVVDSISKFTVVFGSAKTEREYSAYLRLFIFINNTTKQANILLKARPRRFINFEQNTIDFGFVPIGTSKDIKIKISNHGAQVLLQDNFFTTKSGVFSNDLLKNLVVPINVSPDFVLSFSPNGEGVSYDTLIVVVQYTDCRDTIFLYVKGFGVPPQDVFIRVGDVEFDPKTENGKLPIFIRLQDSSKSIDLGSFEFKLSFYWGIFNVLGVNGGKIIKDRISNQQREVTLQIDSLYVTGFIEKQFAELYGIPLICDTDFTVVAIYDCIWEKKGFVRNTILDSGSIKTMVCTEGGKRLVKSNTGLFVKIDFNDDRLLIQIQPNVPGVYYVKVYDILGCIIYEEEIEIGNLSLVAREIKIPSNMVSSGILFVGVSNSLDYKVFKTIYFKR